MRKQWILQVFPNLKYGNWVNSGLFDEEAKHYH